MTTNQHTAAHAPRAISLVCIATVLAVLAGSMPAVSANSSENAPAPARLDVGPGSIVELRAGDIRAAAADGFSGHLNFGFGTHPPKVIPVTAATGQEIKGFASFVATEGDRDVRVALTTSRNETALLVAGTIANGEMILGDLFVNESIVSISPSDASIRISSGTVNGHFEVTALYKTWSGDRKFRFGVAPAPAEAAGVPTTMNAINASPDNATAYNVSTADAQKYAYETYTGDGPELVAHYRVRDGPLTLRYSLVVLDGKDEPLLSWDGTFSWVDSVVLGATVHKSDRAPEVLRSVTVRPVRESSLASYDIGNGLILKKIVPAHHESPLDPYAVAVLLCGDPCPAPTPPAWLRFMDFLHSVASNLPLVLLGLAAVVAIVAFLVMRRHTGHAAAAGATDAERPALGEASPPPVVREVHHYDAGELLKE